MGELNEKSKRRSTKVVRVLTDPIPNYVSLVDHGANQTPFLVVKCDASLAVAGTPTETSEADMSKRQRTRKVATDLNGAKVVAYRFPSDKFDADAAKQFMTDAGYEKVQLSEQDGFDGIVARVEAEDTFDASEVKSIVLDSGAEVLAVKTEVDAPEEEHEAEAKSDQSEEAQDTPEAPVEEAVEKADSPLHELSTKYDAWYAEWSDGKTLQEVMKEGADGLPPGIHEVNGAFYTALRNSLVARDTQAVRSLVTEFGELIIRMADLFSAATFPEELVEKMMAPAEDVEEQVTTKADVEVVDESVEGTDDARSESTAKEDGAEASGVSEASTGEAVKSDAAPSGFGEVLGAISGLVERFDAVDKRLADLETSQKMASEAQEEAGKELTQKVAKVVDEVDSLKKATTQTRKSVADAFDNVPQTARKRHTPDDPLARSTLGFANPR